MDFFHVVAASVEQSVAPSFSLNNATMMRKSLFLISLILSPFSAFCATAQNIALDIQYVCTMSLPDDVVNGIEDVASRQATIDYARNYRKTYSLYYNGRVALFSEAERTDTTGVKFGEKTKLYADIATNETVAANDLLGKVFFVKGTLPVRNWEIQADKTSTVLGRTCVRARVKDERGEALVAWFCPEIAAPIGPDGYGGLPGLVLKVSNQAYHYEATAIRETRPDVAIAMPRGRDTMTSAEFKKLEAKKYKAMGAEQAASSGGVGVMVIKM